MALILRAALKTLTHKWYENNLVVLHARLVEKVSTVVLLRWGFRLRKVQGCDDLIISHPKFLPDGAKDHEIYMVTPALQHEMETLTKDEGAVLLNLPSKPKVGPNGTQLVANSNSDSPAIVARQPRSESSHSSKPFEIPLPEVPRSVMINPSEPRPPSVRPLTLNERIEKEVAFQLGKRPHDGEDPPISKKLKMVQEHSSKVEEYARTLEKTIDLMEKRLEEMVERLEENEALVDLLLAHTRAADE